MKPRRTHTSDRVFRLEGGNEDNDLWVTTYHETPALGSTWEPTAGERDAIARGANIELITFATAHPPIAMRLSPYALGRAPNDDA